MSNTTITNAIGRVKGKINPNTKLSPYSREQNLYSSELVSPQSNIPPKIKIIKIIQSILIQK